MGIHQSNSATSPRHDGDPGDSPAALDAALGEAAAGASRPMAPEEAAAGELAAERDRNLRLRAELENVRSRAARELVEQARYAALPLVRDLLPVVDNIDRAIEHASPGGDGDSLLEGIRLVRQQLTTVLDRHECREIAALGEAFDPQMHAAILQQPSDEYPANHVMMVAQTGYRLHDRVVRPAQVIVSSGPATA